MLTITIVVNAPIWTAQGVKEHLAMCLEQFGDVRVVSVESAALDTLDGQLDLEGGP